jgi:hypothetical protein
MAVDTQTTLALNVALRCVLGARIVDSRYFLSVFIGLFAAVTIFAAVTTVRHISQQPIITTSR